MRKVKVGILGLGDWGVSHLEAYKSLPQAEVVAVCEPNAERLRTVADRFEIAGRGTTDEDLWLQADVDLVSVVNYERDHLAPVGNALHADKHVIVEKPVSTMAGEARQMDALAREKDKYLVPGHLLRLDPRYVQMHDLLTSGEVGDPVTIYSKRARPKRLLQTYRRVHTVFESMIHDIDLAIWYTGSRVTSLRAHERSVSGADAPDILWAWLEFENGALAVLQSNWMTVDEARVDVADTLEIIGETGTLSMDTVNSGPQLWNQSGRHAFELNHHSVVGGRVQGALRELLGYVCDSILTGEPPSRLPFDDAIHGVEVAEAIRGSARSGRELDL